jgi:hypothetical protein
VTGAVTLAVTALVADRRAVLTALLAGFTAARVAWAILRPTALGGRVRPTPCRAGARSLTGPTP